MPCSYQVSAMGNQVPEGGFESEFRRLDYRKLESSVISTMKDGVPYRGERSRPRHAPASELLCRLGFRVNPRSNP